MQKWEIQQADNRGNRVQCRDKIFLGFRYGCFVLLCFSRAINIAPHVPIDKQLITGIDTKIEVTMTETEVSIYILSWWHKIEYKHMLYR